jgi:hypothetical protein
MGACDFMFSRKGTDVNKLFNEAREQAQYEHGHGGYSGTVAEKDSVEVRRANQPVLPKKDAMVLAGADIEENDKWGPAFAMPFGENGKIEGYIFYGFASE